MVIMYRGLSTIGVVVTRAMPGNIDVVSANAIGDYSYISARDSAPYSVQIARCTTGLGPSSFEDNDDVGEVSFNGTSITFSLCDKSPAIVQPRS